MHYAVPMWLVWMACAGDAADTRGRDSVGAKPDTETPETPDTADEVVVGPLALQTRPQNVLVVTIDTLRRDHVGWFSGGSLSPHLDALMAEGVVLADHRSCTNWTLEAVICVQAGAPAHRLGYVTASAETATRVGDELQLASEVLADAGFQTLAVSAHQFFTVEMNTLQGFATIDQDASTADDATDRALAVADGLHPDQPWYLHLHVQDPHAPFAPPEDWLGGLEGLDELEWDLGSAQGHSAAVVAYHTEDEATQELIAAHMRARYEGEVGFTDQELGRFFEGLDARGLLDDTLVLVWSDHGEQIYEHGLPSHGSSLHYEETDALGFFWAKELSAATWTEPTSHLQLWPTLAAVLGVAAPSAAEAPVVGEPVEGVLAWQQKGEQSHAGVVHEGWKLSYRFDGTKGLYELGSDPLETDDRYDEETERVEALWELLMPEVASLAEVTGVEAVDAGP